MKVKNTEVPEHMTLDEARELLAELYEYVREDDADPDVICEILEEQGFGRAH